MKQWLLVVVLSLGMAGCSFIVDLPGDEGRPCDANNLCKDGFHCENAVCVPGPAHLLTLTITGNGSGTVVSTPAGIDCPGTRCVTAFVPDTPVSLTATPAAGSVFGGWSGGGCAGVGACTFALTAPASITAWFNAVTHPLTVNVTGSGTVNSIPAGINCSSGSCTNPFVAGSQVTLTATASADAVFIGWAGSGCSGTGTCVVSMTGPLAVSAAFAPASPLTVMVAGNGSGAVTSAPSGLNCSSGTCTGYFQTGSSVTLTAKSNVGSYFPGWTAGDCSGAGPRRTCTVSMSQGRNATATFSNQTNNIVFVSSETFPATLGSVAAYDTECNRLATAAGLNNASNDAYVAWMSSGSSNAIARLGSARGFMRVDGRPFADDLASLAAQKIYNPIRLDENGVDVGNEAVWTGTGYNGTNTTIYCQNWTSNATTATVGSTSGGPQLWTSNDTSSCIFARKVYCLMKTKNTPLTITPVSGKLIFVTNSYVFAYNGVGSADSICASSRPAGAGTVIAVLPTSTRSASSLFSTSTRYVRPDGQLVGTGLQIRSSNLESGVWLTGDSQYVTNYVTAWTGSVNLGDIPSSASICTDWTSSSGSVLIGDVRRSDTSWWSSTTANCNASGVRFYCIEL